MRLALFALALTITALAGSAPASAQDQVSVTVGDFYFCAPSMPPSTCVTTIEPGDTILWEYPTGVAGHTVTHCGESCDSPTDSPLFDSGGISPGGSFSFTFDSPGTYLYRCDFHPQAMRATVVVEAAQPEDTPTSVPTATATSAATATATASPTAAPEPEPSPTPTAIADPVESDDGGTPLWVFIVAGVGGGAAALVVAGLLIWRRVAASP